MTRRIVRDITVHSLDELLRRAYPSECRVTLDEPGRGVVWEGRRKNGAWLNGQDSRLHRKILLASLVEDATYGYEVLVGGAGLSRDGDGNLVFAVGGAGEAEVRIRLHLGWAVDTIPLLYSISAEADLVVTTEDFSGGTATCEDDARFGITCAAEGEASKQMGAFLANTAAGDWRPASGKYNGATWGWSVGAADIAANWKTIDNHIVINETGTANYPSYFAHGRLEADTYRTLGGGQVGSGTGFDFSTKKDQGLRFIDISAASGGAGEFVATLKSLLLTKAPIR